MTGVDDAEVHVGQSVEKGQIVVAREGKHGRDPRRFEGLTDEMTAGHGIG